MVSLGGEADHIAQPGDCDGNVAADGAAIAQLTVGSVVTPGTDGAVGQHGTGVPVPGPDGRPVQPGADGRGAPCHCRSIPCHRLGRQGSAARHTGASRLDGQRVDPNTLNLHPEAVGVRGVADVGNHHAAVVAADHRVDRCRGGNHVTHAVDALDVVEGGQAAAAQRGELHVVAEGLAGAVVLLHGAAQGQASAHGRQGQGHVGVLAQCQRLGGAALRDQHGGAVARPNAVGADREGVTGGRQDPQADGAEPVRAGRLG